MELQVIGSDVIIIAPGSVATSVWNKAQALPLDQLKGTIWERPFKTLVEVMMPTCLRRFHGRHLARVTG